MKTPKKVHLHHTKNLPGKDHLDQLSILFLNTEDAILLIKHLLHEVSNTSKRATILKSEDSKYFILKVKDN